MTTYVISFISDLYYSSLDYEKKSAATGTKLFPFDFPQLQHMLSVRASVVLIVSYSCFIKLRKHQWQNSNSHKLGNSDNR